MLEFHKYVAAGNDFIIFDNWSDRLELSSEEIISLCDRRFGIGADGIMLLEPHQDADFRMNYYNSDGSRGEMCGNGARALVAFALAQGRIESDGIFKADDGIHHFSIINKTVGVQVLVSNSLQSSDLPVSGCAAIDTGVPHLIVPVDGVATYNLNPLGVSMNSNKQHPLGTNVNIVGKTEAGISVRTWERGVNGETLACGTGATATAIFANQVWGVPWPISLDFKGGELHVDKIDNQYWLSGPAKLVFIGHVPVSVLNRN